MIKLFNVNRNILLNIMIIARHIFAFVREPVDAGIRLSWRKDCEIITRVFTFTDIPFILYEWYKSIRRAERFSSQTF
jgi:hypothetical protein